MASPLWEQIAAGSALVAIAGTGWAVVARDGVRRSVNELRASRRSHRAERAAVEATLEEEAFDPGGDPQRRRARFCWRRRITGATGDTTTAGALTRRRSRGGSARTGSPARSISTATRASICWSSTVTASRMIASMCGSALDSKLDVRQHWVDPHTIHVDDRWTLGRHGGRWELLDGRGDRFARPVLSRPLIPTAWEDEDRLREQALTELASDCDRPPAPRRAHEQPGAGARDRLLDLAVIDNRFSPALIDATIRHLLDAWEQETLDRASRLDPLASTTARWLLLEAVCKDLLLACGSPSGISSSPAGEPIAVEPDEVPPAVTVGTSRSPRSASLRTHTTRSSPGTSTTPACDRDRTWTLELTDHPAALWQLVPTRSQHLRDAVDPSDCASIHLRPGNRRYTTKSAVAGRSLATDRTHDAPRGCPRSTGAKVVTTRRRSWP